MLAGAQLLLPGVAAGQAPDADQSATADELRLEQMLHPLLRPYFEEERGAMRVAETFNTWIAERMPDRGPGALPILAAARPLAITSKDAQLPEAEAREILSAISSPYGDAMLVKRAFSVAALGQGGEMFGYRGSLTRGPGLSDKLQFRELLLMSFPPFIDGHALLTWRSAGDNEDQLWVASAVTRKVRQLTGTNRSDPILDLPIAMDDLGVWDGNAALWDLRSHGQQQLLVPFVEHAVSKAVRDKDGCLVIDSAALLDPSDTLNESPGLPIDTVFAPRPLMHFELRPHDPFSPFGRLDLFVDSEFSLPAFKIVYGRSGEVERVVFAAFGAAIADEGRFTPYVVSVVARDLRSSARASLHYEGTAVCKDLPAGFDASVLTPAAMSPMLASSDPGAAPSPGPSKAN